MKCKNIYLLIVFLFCGFKAFSQGVYVPMNEDYYHMIDRYEIKTGRMSKHFFTTIKTIRRQDLAAFIRDVEADSAKIRFSKRDRFNLNYLKNDNWEWFDEENAGDSRKPINRTFFRNFYRKQNSFYSVTLKNKIFELQINPVFYFSGGRENNGQGFTYINSRGLELRGMIGRKLGFYTYFSENQAAFPFYQREFINRFQTVPEEGFWKEFKQSSYDYFSPRGYITFSAIKDKLQFQFGHDKHFIGNGFRSLMLSDFGPSYLFLKINTKVWIFNYMCLFAQQMNSTSNIAYQGFTRKYMTTHHLSVNLGKHFNIGLYEAIISHGTKENPNRFELNYINPIIFYRAIENYTGSDDAAHVGIDFKANFLRHFQLYGQIVINEFKVNEVRKGKGWFGNQQAVQLGMKYIDVAGIRNLDLQYEANYVRPYMYTDKQSEGSYTHYNQPLAHPLGANFLEHVFILRYQPHKRLFLNLTSYYAVQGLDRDTSFNYGSNILQPYTSREQEYGNYTARLGERTQTIFADFTFSYMFRHNLFLDVKGIFRKRMSETGLFDNTNYFGSVSVRMNIARRMTAY